MGKTPEGDDCECSWMEKAKAICMVIAALTTAIASITAAIFGSLNHQRIDTVQTTQDVQVEKAEERDAKLEKIDKAAEKTATTVTDTLGPQLWSTWKYLQGVAEDYPTPENIAKAKEAKLAYDTYTRKK